MPEPRQIDLIWNLTRLCPWDCAVCCVDAVHVAKSAERRVTLRTEALTSQVTLPAGGVNAFEIAAAHYRSLGAEMSLVEKLRVLDHLDGFNVKLDISGGDPLTLAENWTVLEAAAARFGRDHVTVTATGRGVATRDIQRLARNIGEFNFSYDLATIPQASDRPAGYSTSNLALACKLLAEGVRVRAELPLRKSHCSREFLRAIYVTLTNAGVQRLLVMRLFPVGRGTLHADAIPSRSEYVEAIAMLRALEHEFRGPAVSLQCALRSLDRAPTTAAARNPCDLLAHSLGLMADGTLLLSPWAIGSFGEPLSAAWVIGNLAATPLKALLDQPTMDTLRQNLDANSGHCKIFAYIHSGEASDRARLLDRSDPLYSGDAVGETRR